VGVCSYDASSVRAETHARIDGVSDMHFAAKPKGWMHVRKHMSMSVSPSRSTLSVIRTRWLALVAARETKVMRMTLVLPQCDESELCMCVCD